MGNTTRDPNSNLPDKQKDKLYPIVLKLFSTKDFHHVSMREISRLSGLSTTTLYRYFPSKESLLFSILNEKIGLLADKTRLHVQGLESTREMFRKIFWVTLDHYDCNPGLAVTVFITAPTHSWIAEKSYVRKDAYDILHETIKYGREHGEIDPEISDEQIIDLYFMYCHRQVLLWYFRNQASTLVESIGKFFNVFWKAIAA
ncbi:TetR/AcrR family transcriptional regulator [bacterium]|nr:TetR/AcrR family transcriptional regulator [bacterium]